MIGILFLCACVFCVFLGCKQDIQQQSIPQQDIQQRSIPQQVVQPRVETHERENEKASTTIEVVVSTNEGGEEPHLPSYSDVTDLNRTSHPL